MELENKIEYASRLADPDSSHEFEDLVKLASLCDEIQQLKLSGHKVNSNAELEFNNRIKLIFTKNGSFRSEVERFPLAKKLIKTLSNIN